MAGALALLLAGGPALPVSACPPEVVEPARQFSGIYVDDFEGRRFFEGARTLAEIDLRVGPKVWFSPDIVDQGARFGIDRRYQGHAYRMAFRGTKRGRTARKPACGYGHMNVFDAQIDLITLEAIEPLGAAR